MDENTCKLHYNIYTRAHYISRAINYYYDFLSLRENVDLVEYIART